MMDKECCFSDWTRFQFEMLNKLLNPDPCFYIYSLKVFPPMYFPDRPTDWFFFRFEFILHCFDK